MKEKYLLIEEFYIPPTWAYGDGETSTAVTIGSLKKIKEIISQSEARKIKVFKLDKKIEFKSIKKKEGK